MTRALGIVLALPWLVLVLLVATGHCSWSGLAYLAAAAFVIVGLVRRQKSVAWGGAGGFAFVALVRCVTGGAGEHVQMHGGARLVARLVEEGDAAVAATNVLVATGLLKDDARELPHAMKAAYEEMKREEGDVPSPLVPTYLGMQDPSGFDLLLFEKGTTTGVIFLHGFAGAFTLPCWQVAHAVEVTTACPSTRWVGDWWSPEGRAILERTVAVMKAKGATTIILAGLSNGGYGASRLAPKMRGTFAGLVLISGAAHEAGPSGIPTLVIHGSEDAMAPASGARDYVSRNGGELVWLPAGHFAMLVRRREHDRALHRFVQKIDRTRLARR